MAPRTTTARPIFVVAGIGAGAGTGASAARLFAANGFRVAIIARGADRAEKLASEINTSGGEAAGFGTSDYTYKSILAVWDTIKSYKWPSTQESAPIRVALWNTGDPLFKGFLDVSEQDLNLSLEGSVQGPFAFARQAVLTFRENEVDDKGKRGTLLFTGATASTRGNTWTSAVAAGKFGLRALSQSLAKEFGKENIHVAHAIIDGGILTERRTVDQTDGSKDPRDTLLHPDSIASAYLYLANQDRSAWTWELDLRPAHEKW
ncbi:short-chain dehydrogenase/reductase SDR [Irpex rosettiformis]|uniref:Short-chain dehydrogenase/reductase SDR n=1 Tax=Irpex rosettiformis TaxID=378272 RepID=A0ACB8TVH5_9APHY|nr:short-chain dehydrogenase/reductase SDR [Irpex rosettiformis]